MSHSSEYHNKGMRSSISVTAVLGSVAVALSFAPSIHAQINGAPASVTSPGFGGRPVNGPPASVTSLGPRGYTPIPGPPFVGNGVHHHDHNGNHNGNHDGHSQRRDSNAVGPVWYAVPVPYGVDNGAMQEQPEAADDESDYQGGPTVFDRRGNGESSYVPPAKQAAPAHATERAEDDPPAVDPDPPLPATLLVFKDGRTVEVGNYAIQGSTLFDLTPGHRRKILIADLDLDATRKQNDERGVTFQLPQSTRVN
jgi:hypothetical protein